MNTAIHRVYSVLLSLSEPLCFKIINSKFYRGFVPTIKPYIHKPLFMPKYWCLQAAMFFFCISVARFENVIFFQNK